MNYNYFNYLSTEGYVNTIIINTKDENIIDSLKDIFIVYDVISLSDSTCFIVSAMDKHLTDTLRLFMNDFGEEFKVFHGLHLTKTISLEKVNEIIEYVLKYMKETKTIISTVSTLCLNDWSNKTEYINSIYNNVLKDFLLNQDNYNLITTYFNNNLNVLKTSKDLYLSRSSILFRIKNIYKYTSFNLEKFLDCSAISIIINKYLIK